MCHVQASYNRFGTTTNRRLLRTTPFLLQSNWLHPTNIDIPLRSHTYANKTPYVPSSPSRTLRTHRTLVQDIRVSHISSFTSYNRPIQHNYPIVRRRCHMLYRTTVLTIVRPGRRLTIFVKGLRMLTQKSTM
jgi:hypothetical protein